MSRSKENPRDRIIQNVKVSGDCWIWTGSYGSDGYGVIGIGRKQFRTHRVSFEIFSGKCADGLLVCHKCDDPRCVNPEHLFVGTPKDNTQDMIAKGRKYKMENTNHPLCKITHKQRKEIISRRDDGETLKEIAKDYGVHFGTISAICKGSRSYAATIK